MKRVVVVVAVVVIGLGLAVAAAATGAQEPSATLNFLVLKDYNGKPIRNAAVVLHPVNSRGKQGRGGYELKTDMDGKTTFDGVPYGKLRVQVLAPGFQTFGEDYDIQAPTKEIIVKLKRPQDQYSVYEQHPDQNKPEQNRKDEK